MVRSHCSPVTTTTTTLTTGTITSEWGNANLRDGVTVADAVLIARIAASDKSAAISEYGRVNADVTHDGVIDNKDLVKLLKFLANPSVDLSR